MLSLGYKFDLEIARRADPFQPDRQMIGAGSGHSIEMPFKRTTVQTLTAQKTNTNNNVKVRKYFPETWLWNTTDVGYKLSILCVV